MNCVALGAFALCLVVGVASAEPAPPPPAPSPGPAFGDVVIPPKFKCPKKPFGICPLTPFGASASGGSQAIAALGNGPAVV
jgi:hypothetical protein